MTTRAYIAFVLVLMVNAVMFGAGAIMVLSVPALSERAPYLLPAVVAISTIVSPLLAWAMAPTLRTLELRPVNGSLAGLSKPAREFLEGCGIGRGDMIRTRDPLLPKQMLYQAELRPDLKSILPMGRRF